MSERSNSLWSSEIKPGILSPREILETQAVALSAQSGGWLTAEFHSVHDKAEGGVNLSFDMVAPALNGARHCILTARYFAERIYPCHLDSEGLRCTEIAHSDEELQQLVKQILHSGEVKSLALSLIARAKEMRSAEKTSPVPHRSSHKHLFRPSWKSVESDEELQGTVEALYDEAHGID